MIPLSNLAPLSKLWWYLLLRLLWQLDAAALKLQAGPCLWLVPRNAAWKSFLLNGLVLVLHVYMYLLVAPFMTYTFYYFFCHMN